MPATHTRPPSADIAMNTSGTMPHLRSPPVQSCGVKRKAAELEKDSIIDTNIQVVVRCRGRSEREVRENSCVVVKTEGVKGKHLELSLGPNSLSNKNYEFDKVFSSAADQATIFEDVVVPILDEVLSGFNCTLFAYGQTGTGKTYTMSGDISDVTPVPDTAGIVPRVLHYIFKQLESSDTEHTVKCSFIELYNEELRDLLAPEENMKLKIYDDATRRGQGGTSVQGIEESYIDTATKGVQLLHLGSLRRQVAATKCNDLSSRSHTVFTITVYAKRTSETGEDLVSTGKLNLVDLAGSENIQRSGAENKRAAEAGLINRSLLTLGRVINALVDKSQHVPYRESKLTRLLQDSLGGRTKTCIIATISPAKGNLEETISTLDYAFRAKNIRNKPQYYHILSKKTLLREFAMDIERLKSELIVTRQRNGVYMSPDNYEQMTTESESRRILNEEQRQRIEALETNLRNKIQDLYHFTNDVTLLRKENEDTRNEIEETKATLENREADLIRTTESLQRQTMLRNAYEETECKLAEVGEQMIRTLKQTTADIDGLQSKHRRKSELHLANKKRWELLKTDVSHRTRSVESAINDFRSSQSQLVQQLSERLEAFLRHQCDLNVSAIADIGMESQDIATTQDKAIADFEECKTIIDKALEKSCEIRDCFQNQFSSNLNDLSLEGQRMSVEVVRELNVFEDQLHEKHESLALEMGGIFGTLSKRVSDQQREISDLRCELDAANKESNTLREVTKSHILDIMQKSKEDAKEERARFTAQIKYLLADLEESNEQSATEAVETVFREFDLLTAQDRSAHDFRVRKIDALEESTLSIMDESVRRQERAEKVTKKVFEDLVDATNTIRHTSASIHENTVEAASKQKAQLELELAAFTKDKTAEHKRRVVQSYDGFASHLEGSVNHSKTMMNTLQADGVKLQDSVAKLDEDLRAPVAYISEAVRAQSMLDYEATGTTPQRRSYDIPQQPSRTKTIMQNIEQQQRILRDQGMDSQAEQTRVESSPTKKMVFTDDTPSAGRVSTDAEHRNRDSSSPTRAASGGLRELNVNTIGIVVADTDTTAQDDPTTMTTNGARRNAIKDGKLTAKSIHQPMRRSRRKAIAAEICVGRENIENYGTDGYSPPRRPRR